VPGIASAEGKHQEQVAFDILDCEDFRALPECWKYVNSLEQRPAAPVGRFKGAVAVAPHVAALENEQGTQIFLTD
jgi:hypothetical protein